MHRDPTFDYSYPEPFDEPLCVICGVEAVPDEGDSCFDCDRQWGVSPSPDARHDETALLAGEVDDDV